MCVWSTSSTICRRCFHISFITDLIDLDLQSSCLRGVSQISAGTYRRFLLILSMDPSLIQAAPNPYESDSPSEDEGTLSQNPSSAVPHTISKVENTREPRIPWSDADVDLLMSLRHEGMPFEEISKRFEGRSPWA